MFDHTIGHEDVGRRFAELMRRKRLHHAWLLYGVKGVGKATEAMALAARYLCESPPDDADTACGSCHACRMLAAGSHPDFYAVAQEEGKRDISVAQVRELLSFLAMSGMESERRVVILDDAELMNGQAANALLKGLEEPASGSLLLIVCHDLLRLPATIRSRCLLEHCAPLDEGQVRQVFARMAIDGPLHDMALQLAQGRPGMVASLENPAVAGALQAWQRLTGDLAGADVGELEAWLTANVAQVPHELVADTLVDGLRARLVAPDGDYERQRRLTDSVWKVVAWPKEVVRHSLRAAPALLAHILEIRAQIRS